MRESTAVRLQSGVRSRNLRLVVGFAAAYALLLVANAVLPAVGGRPEILAAIHTLPPRLHTPLMDASAQCAAGVLRDHGLTLYVDTAGEQPGSGTLTLADVSCILRALGAPATVLEEVGSAQNRPGIHNASWTGGGMLLPKGFDLDGSFSAAWTFEPRSGLDLVIVVYYELPDVTIYQLPAFQSRSGAGR
jgi:hypothetical protein